MVQHPALGGPSAEARLQRAHLLSCNTVPVCPVPLPVPSVLFLSRPHPDLRLHLRGREPHSISSTPPPSSTWPLLPRTMLRSARSVMSTSSSSPLQLLA